MPRETLPPITADIEPEKFADGLVFANNRTTVFLLMVILVAVGLGLRVSGLGTESLGEDELNKLQTVEEYRTNGLTGKNGEHPFLMKGLQTLSVSAAEKISTMSPSTPIPEEAALRFPVALFGTFTTLLMFLFVSRLFGRSIGLVSAALWAVEPMAIGFDRVAKEDSLVLFFFLLTGIFWLRAQTRAELGDPKWRRCVWAAGVSFAGLMASKYYPFFLAVPVAYYNMYRDMPERRWDMHRRGWLILFLIMGFAFLTLNPTILLPDTWREMAKFSSENRIGHDSYEFAGTLYRNQTTAWLSGVPWTFFFVFAAVKSSIATIVLFLVGLPLMLKRRLGDGRFYILLWAVIWLISYTFTGGKFTRYFTTAAPLVFIVAAVGFCLSVKWLSDKLPNAGLAAAMQVILAFAFITIPLADSLSVSPHFRLFTNPLGGGMAAAGTYFPHDEYYDLTTREGVTEIVRSARPNAVVACETPALFEYYSRKAGRGDLIIVSLSDKAKVQALAAGDFIVAAKGRRYFSNSSYLDYLAKNAAPVAEVNAGQIPSTLIYKLDDTSLAGVKATANQ